MQDIIQEYIEKVSILQNVSAEIREEVATRGDETGALKKVIDGIESGKVVVGYDQNGTFLFLL